MTDTNVLDMRAEADAIRRRRPDAIADAIARHPASSPRHTGTRRGLVIAASLIATHDLPECNVHVWDDGQIIVFDYTGKFHAAGDVAVAARALGMRVEEHAAETADGCAAVELRGQDYQDGILRTVRAVIPVPAAWGAL